MDIPPLTRLLEIIPGSHHFIPPWIPHRNTTTSNNERNAPSPQLISQATASQLLLSLQATPTQQQQQKQQNSQFRVFNHTENSASKNKQQQQQQQEKLHHQHRQHRSVNGINTSASMSVWDTEKIKRVILQTHHHRQGKEEKEQEHNQTSRLFLTSTSKLRRVSEAFALLRNGVLSCLPLTSTSTSTTTSGKKSSSNVLSSQLEAVDHVSLYTLMLLQTRAASKTQNQKKSSIESFCKETSQEYSQMMSLIRDERKRLAKNNNNQHKQQIMINRVLQSNNSSIDAVANRLDYQDRVASKLSLILDQCCIDSSSSTSNSTSFLSKFSSLLQNFEASVSTSTSSSGIHPELVAQWLLEPNTIKALLSSNFHDLTSMVTISTFSNQICQVSGTTTTTTSSSVSNSSSSSSSSSISVHQCPIIFVPSISLEKPRHWGPLMKPLVLHHDDNNNEIETITSSSLFDLQLNHDQLQNNLQAKISTILLRSLVHAGINQFPHLQLFVMNSLFTLPVNNHPIFASHCSCCEDEKINYKSDSDDARRKRMNINKMTPAQQIEAVEIEALFEILYELESRRNNNNNDSGNSPKFDQQSLKTIVLVPNSKHQEETWRMLVCEKYSCDNHHHLQQQQQQSSTSINRPLSLFSISIVPFGFDIMTFLVRCSSLKMTMTMTTTNRSDQSFRSQTSNNQTFACVITAPSSFLMCSNGCDLMGDDAGNLAMRRKFLLDDNSDGIGNGFDLFRKCLELNFDLMKSSSSVSDDSDDDEDEEDELFSSGSSSCITLPRQIVTVDPFFT